MKTCCSCQEEKSFINFCKDKKRKDGLNPECRTCVACRFQFNKTKYKITQQIYQIKHRQRLLIQKRNYTLMHKNEKSTYDITYRTRHATHIAAYKKAWEKEQRKNPIYRLKINLRRRIIHALNGSLKAQHTFELLGCDIETFKLHLESKFQTDMSWPNYGQWHIDHIKPCCLFDLSKPEEQKTCFHYTNLQPLWAKDNLKKARHFI